MRAFSAARTTLVCMVWPKTATRMATPRRKPSCLLVLSMPEPEPRSPVGSDAMPAEVRHGKVIPRPAPTSAVRQATWTKGSVRITRARKKRPTKLTRAPMTASQRGPKRSISRPVKGENTRPAAGTKVTAAAARNSL